MAHFNLDNDHRLFGDARQWALQKRTTNSKTGEDTWVSLRFYPTLQGAIKASYEYFIRTSEADDIQSFMAESNRIFNKFIEVLSPVMETREK